MARIGSQRLSAATRTELQDAIVPRRGGARAISPEQQLYGIFGPQLAALLAQPKKSSAEGAFDRAHLEMKSAEEARNYAEALDAANRAQMDIANTEGYYGVLGEMEENYLGSMDRGVAGGRRLVVGPDGRAVIESDPIVEAVGNQNQLNNDQAERFGVYATGTKALADAGYGMSPEEVGKLVTPPGQETPQPYGVYQTPSDKTAAYSADEGMTVEEQMELAAIRSAAEESGEDLGEITVKTDSQGKPIGTDFKGTPEQVARAKDWLARNGRGPDGRRINPNAGASGGAAPAKPAAEARPRPVADAGTISAKLYGAEGITQVRRDPKSKLGKANPTSWHNRTGAAVDRKPIKGMTFEQYVDGYRKAGYEIIEARDEVKNPSKHATGPHWHVVLGEKRNTGNVQMARLKRNPNVIKTVDLGEKGILVTLKSGRQVVVKDGKVVGG